MLRLPPRREWIETFVYTKGSYAGCLPPWGGSGLKYSEVCTFAFWSTSPSLGDRVEITIAPKKQLKYVNNNKGGLAMPKSNARRADGLLKSKIYLGNGKYKYVYARTQKELSKKVDEVKTRLGKGLDVSAEHDTFGNWAERWLKLKQGKISDARFKSYQYRVKKLESIENIPITKITVADIQEIIDARCEQGDALKTLKEYKSVVSQIFEYAIVNRVIDFNPTKGIEMPNADEAEPRRALTDEEISWINADTEHRAHIAAMIMLYAGLRRGELLALTWNDIDIKNRTINVCKAVEMVDGAPVVKPRTKTKAGMRKVRIPTLLADYLIKQRAKASSLLVCPNSNGSLMSGDSWRKLWDSYLKELNFRFGNFDNLIVQDPKTGKIQQFKKPASIYAPVKIPMVIPHITAHWLRHTFITMMYKAGVDIMTASKQAGHADINTTLQIYTHLDNEYKNEQMDKLDDYLYGGKMGVKNF